jgi:hypothetical protein
MSTAELLSKQEYKYGFVTDIESDVIPRGLTEDTIRLIVELHQIVDNALSEITLSQLLGTEANVDALLHQIQSTKQRIDVQA